MQNLRIIPIILTVGTFALSGIAYGHGPERHGKMVPVDEQMKKLHAMMPMFSVASAGLEGALEKNDLAAVDAEAGKILTAIPDLKKSKPHKNVNQRKKFIEHASNLEKTVLTTVELTKKGDLAGAKGTFKKVEEICAACHAKFRD